MTKTWAEIAAEAKQKTNQQFAGEISSLTRLTREEIEYIAPSKIDKENLTKLIEIVKDATRSNEKKAEAIKSIDQHLSLLISIASKAI